MKKLLVILCFTYIVSRITVVRAEYVLPYPSYMPGSMLYRISRIIDMAKTYWYWGNIARIKYHLALSDKYLVEFKTLMEYNQYLLASDALIRSDREFQELPKYVSGAKRRGIDISVLQRTIQDATIKHIAVLEGISNSAPAQFLWTPEKGQPTELQLGEMLKLSEDLRKHIATEAGSQ